MATITTEQMTTRAIPVRKKMSVMERRRNINAYLFLTPALIIMIAFLFIPMLQVVVYSFTDYNLLNPLTSDNIVGTKNYENLIHDELFWQGIKRSFMYLLVTPILIILSITMAIIVNRPLRGIALFRAMYYIPVVISAVAIGMIFDFVFEEPAGLINGFLREIGLIEKPIHFLTDPDYILPSIMSVTVWRGLGYYMMLFLAGLQNIPEELYEAASIDGATKLKQHIYITVPMLRPVITFVAVISSISALRAFDEIYILAGEDGGLMGVNPTAMFYIYRQAFDFLNIGYASASAVIFTAITLVFSLLNLRFLEEKTN